MVTPTPKYRVYVLIRFGALEKSRPKAMMFVFAELQLGQDTRPLIYIDDSS